ncbi:penicillin acylase family protein [Marinobacter bohaiensis]|uniref:penicillin acylase family protein n=1 Tax=Marinobacter bohaiensis TaxID=2201898 RepID=UPI000DAC6266|nr:penicillin acylase family protein [Marinobacter bohaiensis]
MKHFKKGSGAARRTPWRALGVAVAGSILLGGCFDGDGGSGGDSASNEPLTPSDGQLEATIRLTTGGVPHIKADDLASASFGLGYAQTRDNVCLLAEAIVKARSERAKYFGAGQDDINIINDLSYKAQHILSGAEDEYDDLSEQSRAMIDGFTAGYNKYVTETPAGDLPAECRDQPWVKEIRPQDLLAHYRIVGQYASGALFATGAVFSAVPGEQLVDIQPTPVMASTGTLLNTKQIADNAVHGAGQRASYSDLGLASNAWGIGADMTEQGRGALLANPHFPYTGHRRLYQSQMTVPGYLNINGAGLLGTAIPLISFNESLSWSHTVTTSRRFALYELTLKAGDPLTYIKDGVEKPITSETFQIEVDIGGTSPAVVERTFYFSEYGPMVSGSAITGGGLPVWSDASGKAYSYRDANADTGGLLDTWLGMSRASNLDEFQQVFRDCGSTLWTNSTYADKDGNAFYIDSSSVPNLSEKSIALINFKRSVSSDYADLFDAGLTLLDGSESFDDWVEGDCDGLVPYESKPKLLRSDWVQNSNSSYWATNPDEFLEGFSPMFGTERTPINPRTRLGIKMLQNPNAAGMPGVTPPAGQDGKFGAEDLINVIWNNRAWYAEQFLPELRERCGLIGATTVDGVDLSTACGVLDSWDSVYNLDSVGAHVFRVFIANYADSFETDLTEAFTPDDPVYTPGAPSETDKGTASDPMLLALSQGVQALNAQGIALNATLGSVQYIRPSGDVPPGGTPIFQSPGIPWHGGDGNVDGAFNAIGVVTDEYAEDTRFPRIAPSVVDNTGGLSDGAVAGTEGWLMARGTSWHYGLEFTDTGPEAYGLVSYSQSSDAMSDFFLDQSQNYSDKQYRKLLFTEQEIQQNLLPNGEETINASL